MQIEILIRSFLDGAYDERLLDIYADETKISYQRERYINAIKKFEQCYKPGDVELFSAPGRSEIGGNHTDHQNGEVLAASVNLDTIGIVKKTDDNVIRLVSDNYDEIIIRLDDVSVKEKEKETTKALIKGVVSGFLERKYAVGGFQAYITSDVLIGLQYAKMEEFSAEAKDSKVKAQLLFNEVTAKTKEHGGVVEVQVKILKNRNGSKGSETLDFCPMFNVFNIHRGPDVISGMKGGRKIAG